MGNKQTLLELLKFFKGQRIHRLRLHYKDIDGDFELNNVDDIDIDWCDNTDLVSACAHFKFDSWFLHLTARGGNTYYDWFVDKWNLITDPKSKTLEGYKSDEEYDDGLEHDYLCLDIWITRQ